MRGHLLVYRHGVLPLVLLQHSRVVSVTAGEEVSVLAEDSHPPPVIGDYGLPDRVVGVEPGEELSDQRTSDQRTSGRYSVTSSTSSGNTFASTKVLLVRESYDTQQGFREGHSRSFQNCSEKNVPHVAKSLNN